MENSAQISPKAAEPIIKVRGLRHVYQEGDGTKEVLHGMKQEQDSLLEKEGSMKMDQNLTVSYEEQKAQ